MLEIIIQGRGGQGAQTAGNLLAQAFFAEGKQVQSFASYGGARRGTPVSSFIRIDDEPIRLRCDIEHPGAILCFDASLLGETLLRGAREDTVVVVNSARPPSEYDGLGDYHVFPVDGMGISRRNGLGRIVNSALLGAFTRIVGAPGIETLITTIRETAPVRQEENARACRDGYDAAKHLSREERAA